MKLIFLYNSLLHRGKWNAL